MVLIGCPLVPSLLIGVAAAICTSFAWQPIQLLSLHAVLCRSGVPKRTAARWAFRAVYYPDSLDPTHEGDNC